MTSCPFCQYPNEDGAVFCDQCKSDLAAEVPAALPTLASPPPGMIPSLQAEAAPLPLANAFGAFPIADATASLVDTLPMHDGSRVDDEPDGDSATALSSTSARADAGAGPVLQVVRGLKIDVEYPLFEGLNYLGRTDEFSVDIDLESQESPERVWASRQHAVITFEDDVCAIEDIGSSNGTFVNRKRLPSGQKHALRDGDVIQIGTVHLRVVWAGPSAKGSSGDA